MATMNTEFLSEELMAQLRAAAEIAAAGKHDPEIMKQARDRMNQVREEIYRRNGILDIGVPAIRELRDGKDA